MNGMPSSVNFSGIQRYKDRHGRERLYYRQPGKKLTPLRGPLGSPEFLEDYLKATTGATIAKPLPRTVSRGSMTWLVNQYYESGSFKALADITRRNRQNILRRFLEKYGDLPFESLKPAQVRKIRDQYAEKPEAANNLMKTLAQVFKFAKEYELREDNPVTGIGKLKTRTGGIASWSEKEIRQFEEYHPVGTRARVAFGLLLYTGQRRGDIVRLGRQHEDDGWLYFKQQKTGAEMAIPIFHELREILDAGPVGDLTFLVTDFGKPYTANGFGNKFRDWVEEAGLKGKSAHGLRKSAAQRLALKSHSTNEIAAIGGWETLSEVQRYTKGANRRVLAQKVKDREDE